MYRIFSRYLDKRRELRSARKRREEQLWVWIASVNVSRAAPREMVGPQNLAKLPDWMYSDVQRLVDPQQDKIMKFKEDEYYEYRFKPLVSQVSKSAFYVDVYKRVRHWKKLL